MSTRVHTGTVITPDAMLRGPFGLRCGRCRADMGRLDLIVDGKEMQCPRCNQLHWYAVREGDVTCHPGRRPGGY
jgi:phage FluMu protein Com